MARSSEASKMLAALNSELAAASRRRGVKLEWSPAEEAILGLISATIDRKVGLSREYGKCDSPSLKVKLSAELRQLETQLARLLKQVSPDVPAAPRLSPTSRKAQTAANARWSRVRAEG